MRSHKLVEHIADVRLKLIGDSLKELFAAGVQGMAELIKPGISSQQATEKLTISLDASDETSLIIDFLAEVLTYTHVNRTVYHTAIFSDLSPSHLEAQLQGTLVDSFDEDVKAVTYHEANVKKNKQDLYETTIIFDI